MEIHIVTTENRGPCGCGRGARCASIVIEQQGESATAPENQCAQCIAEKVLSLL